MEFEQLKETQPILAICYDFDKTLSPDDEYSALGVPPVR